VISRGRFFFCVCFEWLLQSGNVRDPLVSLGIEAGVGRARELSFLVWRRKEMDNQYRILCPFSFLAYAEFAVLGSAFKAEKDSWFLQIVLVQPKYLKPWKSLKTQQNKLNQTQGKNKLRKWLKCQGVVRESVIKNFGGGMLP